MNIILIGFMGAGKTETGKLLAKKLKMTYIDTDAIIEKEQGAAINEIFAKKGEECFRDMESKLIDKLAGIKDHVVSTGGGMILRPDNVKKLKKMGSLVLLWADPDTVYERVKGSDVRPLLNVEDQKAKIREILEFRAPIYKGVADLEIDTSLLSPEEASNKILEFAKER
ncbi:MAG: shikimate kinase [bacterium]